MTLPTPLLVQSEAALAECCERCRRADAIAVDTEFERTSTFFPILGLIQLCDGETVWLVDPLAIRDFSALRNLLTDPNVVKVFHSCSEDMDVLRHHLDLVPVPVFDTQVAAAFLGYGYSRGYSALVEKVLDVALEKHETRSDWLQRPLSESQLVYAAEDVHFLIQVYHQLVGELEATGREGWMAEEMAQLQAVAENPEPLENYYLRVKGAWRLPSPDLARLRAMTLWREREARQRNMPRNRVVPDKALLEMLRTGPRNVKGLFGIDGLRPGMVKRYGETLMEFLEDAPDAGEVADFPPPLDREARNLLADCRQVVEQRAGELNMAPELLARKKELEVVVRSALAGQPELPPSLATGWRYEVLGRELENYVANLSL